jgi:hypothetical protein
MALVLDLKKEMEILTKIYIVKLVIILRIVLDWPWNRHKGRRHVQLAEI